MLHKGRRTRVTRDNGGFVANLNFPGWLKPFPTDHGHGPLAMIAESLMVPGRVIEMHEHTNDEIISWVPAGVMRHDDRATGPLVIDAGHLMVMNAGRSFWHSERTLESDPHLRMLQIFVRPDAADLEPKIQFGPLPAPAPNRWREVFGPEHSNARFSVRNRIWCYDLRADAGTMMAFPVEPGCDTYFYVFTGSIVVGGRRFGEAEQGLAIGGEALTLTANEPSVVIAFLIDPNTPVMRLGTVGDHKAIPPARWAPLLKIALALRPRKTPSA